MRIDGACWFVTFQAGFGPVGWGQGLVRLGLAVGVLAALSRPALAQHITIDGSLSPAQTLAGPNYAIGANLGKQVGGNLFHSFGIFGLNRGETANFTGPATVANIIGRVTGGQRSSIDGTIKSSITGANLYLINPAGIVFGPNAAVNVSGSFHAATADYLRLSDGAKFLATTPSGSTLTAAAPAAFGFLNAAPPAITVYGSSLSVPAGQTLGLAGGSVVVVGATLRAPAGKIRITGIAGAGEVPVAPGNGPPTVAAYGPVGIVGGSTLDVSDPFTFGSGGSISIRAGVLIVDASEINANNDGPGSGGALRLHGDSQITLSDKAFVHAFAEGSGPGGDIVLTTGPGGGVTVDSGLVETGSALFGRSGNVLVDAGKLSVLDGGTLASLTIGPADSGSVAVTAGSIAVTDGGSIATVTLGPGNGGDVSLTASGAVTIDSALSPAFGSTAVFTAALGTGVGAAGNMTITAGSLNIVNGGLVGGASFYGTGQNGNVSIEVSGATVIDGGARPTGILSTTIAGTAAVGNIVLHTGRLALSNGGQIAADTYGPGTAGNITVLVDQALTITGSTAAGALTGINSNAEYGSTGNAGTISVSAADLTLSADGVISSQALVGSAGNAGTISVSAGSLSLAGSAQIISSTAGTGDAGTILVSAGTMSMTDDGDINSSTYASGNGGGISVDVAGLLSVDGQARGFSSGIGSQAAPGSTGNAGQVTVSAGTLSVTNGGTISTTTFGSGDAGRVMVSAGAVTLSSIGGIASSTQGAGNGGNVMVAVAGLLAIDGESGNFNSGIGSQALPGSTGNAGRVVVSAGALSLTNGGIISTTTFAPGDAGNIAISVAGAVTMDGGSSLLGSGVFSNTVGTNSGNAGQVAITAASLAMADGTIVSTSTGGAGSGGAVTVDVAGALSVGNFAIITSNANPRSTGNAGRVSVTAGSLSLSGVGQIATTTFGAGNGGDVTVDVAGALTIDGRDQGVPSGILSHANPGSTGNAGRVAVSAGSLSVTNGGEISTSTFGPGNGGNVSVNVAGALALAGQNTVINSNANRGATGNAGTVAIAAGSLTVQDGAQIATLTAGPGAGGNIDISVAGNILLEGPGPQINAQSSSTGNAGSIVVSAADLQLIDGAEISTEAASANGGNITLDVGNLLYLLDSQIRTSVDGAKGNGGNITIDPAFVVLDHSQIVADAVGGNGGNITIDAGSYLASADSLVSATSQLGISGTINISGQNYELDKSLVPLSGALRDTPAVSRDKCAAREGLDRSTLVDAGRGGLPQDPDAAIPALYLAGRGFAGAPLLAPSRGASALPFETAATTLYGGCN